MPHSVNQQICTVLIAAATGLACACPIPVFQYALEHWSSDPYVITLHHQGALTPTEQKAMELLQQAEQGIPTVVNLKRVVDDASPPRTDANGAQFELRFPAASGVRQVVWSDSLNPENVQALLHSPMRETVSNLLADRKTAVWILLESGDRNADRKVASLLKRELKRLEAEILIPEAADWGGETVQIDNHVNFAVVRLNRNNPEEQMLIRMLLASEPDLSTDFEGLPMVFPVYGRGLLLYALVGQGINARTLDDAARFLTGPCSCQIKAANPGTDLLLAFDWDARVTPLTPATVGETVGTGAFLRHMDAAMEEDQ